MLMEKQNELMSNLLFTVHQHGGDDVTWKPPILIKLGVTTSSLWAPLSLTQTNSERLNEQLRATLNNPSEPPREWVRDILERRPQPDEYEAAYRTHDGLKPTNTNYANELVVILNNPWLIINCN